jgi:phage gp45-like
MRRLLNLLAIMAILAVQVMAFLPQPVYAATETEIVSGIGSEQQHISFLYLGAASNYTVLYSDDDNTSYAHVEEQPSGGTHSNTFLMTDFTGSYASISNVTLYTKQAAQYSGRVWHICRIGSTDYLGTQSDVPSGSVYNTYSYSWTTNPASGSAWDSTAINNAEWGWMQSFGNQGGNTTYMYLVVTYTPTSAPIVTTQAVTAITETTATGNGNVTSDGGSTVTERGTVISTSANPTTTDTKDTATGTTGAFTTSITGLTKDTTYHVRAYAINSIGTGYGSDVTFTTSADPTISTVAASQVAATTARLNANVTFDGREACTVTFVYKSGTGFADYEDIVTAGGTQTAASGTYVTGGLPYLDISGLRVLTTYSFAVKITNSVSTAYGSVLTFTTKSGISQPTNLTALPSSTTISLTWTKGSGSTYSLLRYSPAEYPATTTSGSMGYLGTGNSVRITGLTPGTTYYWSAWGMSGGIYSDNYTTALCTTLAYDDAADSDIDIEVPAENDLWMQTPDTSKLDNVPLFNAVVNLWNENYGIPDVSIWYFIWLMIGIGGGILIYTRSSQNLVATFAAELIWFGIGSVMGLIWMWIVFVFIIIALGFIVFGHRH